MCRRTFLFAAVASAGLMAGGDALPVPLPGAPSRAHAQQTVMKAKTEYLTKLQNNAWPTFLGSTQYFKWPADNIAPFPGATKKVYENKNCTRVGAAATQNCVRFVIDISNPPSFAAPNWRAGTQIVQNGKVVTGIADGTIIATFEQSAGGLRYASTLQHAAVYHARVNDKAIEVYDQNWLSVRAGGNWTPVGVVGRHQKLCIGGANQANLSRWFVVQKP